ncbi:FHA domain-containing protein [Antricoccus suffuscus]|uniref:FHA domain-containing protein n=1 Tax=Antricoccus suffuscus TaxID=1629062 RepID=A0A2T1A485_9ACTN|nr:FHA domain-containing protein [Antricoccus suffuscus]PRZ43410.1 FHA domain-containing protein [Antricoccus suffuscus]
MSENFDDIRAVVHAGSDLIARLPGLVAFIKIDHDTDQPSVNELLELIRTASGTAPQAPGSGVARQLSTWLGRADSAPDFGTVAATADGIALFLHGNVAVTRIPAGGGPGTTISGREAAFAVDRMLPSRTDALLLAGGDLDLSSVTTPMPGIPDWASFQAGITAGGAVTIGPPAPSSLPAPRESAPSSPPTPPKLSERIAGGRPVEPREPLPVAAPRAQQSQRERQAEADEGVKSRPGAYVRGFKCSRNHLNDPRVSFCAVCGIRMDQLTGVLVHERRPPLGLLVLDAGSTFVLDDNYILGRSPEVSTEVQSGHHRPIRVDDTSGALSRVHAEIRLEEWDVQLIDRGSANGTFVAGPEQKGWTRLAPRQTFVLSPGTQVRIGRRTFTFESSAARF